MDAQAIKEALTVDDIIVLLDDLGVEPSQINAQYIIFPSICHHKDDWDKHGHKLYYYITSRSFNCFSCGFHGDIFSLVQKVKDIDFKASVKYVCQVCGIELTLVKKSNNIDNWRSELNQFLPDYELIEPLPYYDDNILKLFHGKYHQLWLDYGISKETMAKYDIGFYARCNQITMPIYHDNQLVGIRVRALNDWDVARGKYRPLKDLNNNIYKFPTNATLYGYDQNKEAIKQNGVVWLVEAEKTVLKFDTWGCHNALAVFGSKVGKQQIRLLTELGVKHIVLMMDSDYHTIGDDEYKLWKEKMMKLIGKLKSYFTVDILYNNMGYDAYKFSPTDYTREQFDILYANRKEVRNESKQYT